MASSRQFGDFQTPSELSHQLCDLLVRRGVNPRLVVEPTCGVGSFVLAAAKAFDTAEVLGYDINQAHIAEARKKVEAAGLGHRVTIAEANVFATDWGQQLESAPSPMLVIGNPPWVTSADMRRFGGGNLPEKSNLKGLSGLDAITGAGNFDISEWILLSLLEGLQDRQATVAMLCKKSVARRVVEHAAKRALALDCEGFWDIEAKLIFGVSVAAGFFVFHTGRQSGGSTCDCMELSEHGDDAPLHTFAVDDGLLLSDLHAFRRWRSLRGVDSLRWRSGIKHDCAAVMELRQIRPGVYLNGLGEEVHLEEEYLFPLLKTSDLLHGIPDILERRVLVTQRRVGDATDPIEEGAARTWDYLHRHKTRLDSRASSIYKRRPEFAIFGVGPYAFTPYKVVTSGLSSELRFVCLGPVGDKPVMADDTCYLLGFHEEIHARIAESLLTSAPAQEFLRALMFTDAKRPVTSKLLEQLHLGELARWTLEHDRTQSTQRSEALMAFAELADGDAD